MYELLGHACCCLDISKLLTKSSQKKEKIFIKTQLENKEWKHDNIQVFFGLYWSKKWKSWEHSTSQNDVFSPIIE